MIDFKEPFFRYILFNPIINFAYCLLFFLDFIIKCHPYWFNDLLTKNNCFQKDVSINIIGIVLKIMANFTFTQMYVCRLVLVGEDFKNR